MSQTQKYPKCCVIDIWGGRCTVFYEGCFQHLNPLSATLLKPVMTQTEVNGYKNNLFKKGTSTSIWQGMEDGSAKA